MQFDLFPIPETPIVAPAKSLAGVTLIHGDCLIEMANIPSGSVDMILTDLPYGSTNCHWDSVIPFEPLWEQYKRIIKPNGAIVLTASQPFTSALVMSNIKMFKYEWIWEKNNGANFANVKYMPFKLHENVLIFYKKLPTYNPQRVFRSLKSQKRLPIGMSRVITPNKTKNDIYAITGNFKRTYTSYQLDGLKMPGTVLKFDLDNQVSHLFKHPTKKPVELMQYLIRTYTNEGDTVLDSCMGSGTTGSACVNTNRKFIGIEKDDKYFEIAVNRINNQHHDR